MVVERDKEFQKKLITFHGTADQARTKLQNFELLNEFVNLRELVSLLALDLDEQVWHLAQLFASSAELMDRSSYFRCQSVREISESLHAFVEKHTTLTASDLAVIERHLLTLHEALVDLGTTTDAEGIRSST